MKVKLIVYAWVKEKKQSKEERPPPTGERGGKDTRSLCDPQALPPGFRVLDVGKFGHECVGRRLSVFWDVDDTWYKGSVAAYDEHSGKHRVVYADGEEEDLFLAAETWEYDKDQPNILCPVPPAAEGGDAPPPPVKTEWGVLGSKDECMAGANAPVPPPARCARSSGRLPHEPTGAPVVRRTFRAGLRGLARRHLVGG